MIDTDDSLFELLLIPGIGRAKARALFEAGFRNLSDIADSGLSDLADVEGIGMRMAKNIKDFAEVQRSAGLDATDEAPALSMCPMCGSLLAPGADNCPNCGIAFEGEEEMGEGDAPSPDPDAPDGYWYREGLTQISLCPECGMMIPHDIGECPHCGVVFEGEEEIGRSTPDPPGHSEADALADMLVEKGPDDPNLDGHWYKDRAELFLCPGCGAFISSDAGTCPHCGVVFEGDEEIDRRPEDEIASEVAGMLVEKGPDDPNLDGHWYKDKAEIFLCPECGGFISGTAHHCEGCGVALEGEEDIGASARSDDVIGMLVEAGKGTGPSEAVEGGEPSGAEPETEFYLCPECGALVAEDAPHCKNCGVLFSEDADDVKPTPDGELERLVNMLILKEDIPDGARATGDDRAAKQTGASVDREERKDDDDLDGHWYKDRAELHICPNCGSFISATEDSCEKCGVVFVGEEELAEPDIEEMLVEKDDDLDGHWYKDRAELFLCPECGAFISVNAHSCENCGVAFDAEGDVDEHPLDSEVQELADMLVEKDDDLDGHWYKDRAELFLCPICGAFISSDARSCEGCGVVFDTTEEVDIGHDVRLPDMLSDEGEEAADRPIFLCQFCGAFTSEEATECPVCGEDLMDDAPGTDMTTAGVEQGAAGPATDEMDLIDLLIGVEEGPGDNAGGIDVAVPEKSTPETDSGVLLSEQEDELLRDLIMAEDAPVDGGGGRSAEGAPGPESAVDPEGTDAVADEGGTPPEHDIDELIPVLPEADEMDDAIGDADLDLDKAILDDLLDEGTDEMVTGEAEKSRSIAKDFMKRWANVQKEGTKDIEGISEILDMKEEGGEGLIPPVPMTDLERDFAAELDADIELEAELEAENADLLLIDESLRDEPDNHELWAEKGRLLEESGRLDEAMSCYEKAAELSVENEAAYKRRVLEILHGRKLPDAPDELEVLEEFEPGGEPTGTEKVDERIGEIDELLDYFPGQEELLMEKGDLLKKLGRHDEALACFDEVIRIKHEGTRPATLPGRMGREYEGSLRIGMTNGDGRVNGGVNGLLAARGFGHGRVNGLTNGKTNGRINGMINGHGRVNGLTNGKTNGRINGMINGRGRVNGLDTGLTNGHPGSTNGLVNGAGGAINGHGGGHLPHHMDSGLINGLGLVNGDGLVNGSGRFYRPSARQYSRRHWRGRMTWMVVLIAILLLLPALVNTTSTQGTGIEIDGTFNDWTRIKSHYDSPTDQIINPDTNLLDIKASFRAKSMDTQHLDVYLEVEGEMLGGRSTNSTWGMDSFFIFADADADASTGYRVADIGAEYVLDIQGWNNGLESAKVYEFDQEHDNDDWNGFGFRSTSPVSLDERRLETRIVMERRYDSGAQPRVQVVSQDAFGRGDVSDSMLTPNYATLKAGFDYGGEEDLITAGGRDVNTIVMDTYGFDSRVQSITFGLMGAGDLGQVSGVRLQVDSDGDGIYDDSTDSDVNAEYSEPDSQTMRFDMSEPLEVIVNTTTRLFLSFEIDSRATATTIGVDILEVLTEEGSVVEIPVSRGLMHNIGTPSSIEIDGAFGDWDNVMANVDGANDVVDRREGLEGTAINRNVDLRDYRMLVDDSLNVYGSVSGVIMGGSDVPMMRARPAAAVESTTPPRNLLPDADRDGVPDIYDGPVGSEGRMMYDFDNDGVDDQNESGDIDSDGILDFNYDGPDLWLNITIPQDFPANYSGNAVERYIGPPRISPVKGIDYISVYVDADDNASSGLFINGQFGAEFMVLISGRHNTIYSSELFEYDPLRIVPWRFVGNATAALGGKRFEAGIPLGQMGLTRQQDFNVMFEMSDWKASKDASDDALAHYAQAMGTRSPAGDQVVMNEMSITPNNSEWVELVNPTAGPIDISGYTIQVQIRGWRTIYTVPGGTVLGAFGSGSEFYLASDPFGGPWWLFGNQLRSGINIRLRDGGGTVIDQTTIGNPTTGQTYARWKNVTYGMPTDTDDDANDWYITNSGWIVPEGPTPGTHNDRRRPVFDFAKTGNTSVAAPGTQVVYTITYDNIGDGRSRDLWINDTLPTGMTYVSSSIPYTSVAGNTYTWHFTNVAPGTGGTFTITALVDTAVPLGTVLTNAADLDYNDQIGRPQTPLTDTWDVTVSGPIPLITVQKNASSDQVVPGGGVSYTIWYNNTGTADAGTVWVNDTLPAGVTFSSADPPPASISGQDLYWQFTGVAPGIHSIVIYGTVGSGVAVGAVLTNTVTLDYTDTSGMPQTSSSDSASVTVVDPMFQVLLNEISVQGNTNEWVEVVNPTGVSVDISGWRIRRAGIFGVRYTFPAGTVLGPWGSGTEFFVADVGGGNDFFNAGGTIYLEWDSPGPGWTTIDQTTYPGGIAADQSWSRFKHEDTGVPVDTDNDAGDWYISNNGWIVPEGPTAGGHNDRRRPVMTVAKVADVSQAEPGDLITYTIYYNNTGDGNAKRVWINDTLPSNVDYVSASITPTTISGQDLSWYFSSLLHDTDYSLTVTARVNANASDGESMTNAVTLDYRDQLRRPMASSSAWANVTCIRPDITVEKIANVTQAYPGDSILYTIYYNNTGSVNAGNVWINDTLPSGVTYTGASVAPSSINGQTYTWHFTNVAPGSHSMTITVTVNASSPGGTITNWASLNYTNSWGWQLPGSSDSADVAVIIVPEFQSIAFIIIGMLGLVYAGNRRKKEDENSE